ncbi:MAG: hypothetical protein GY796_13265 [Chloroflexi bacterium]|nr:hypothetical protein [Chloroflexota bacterium]
MMYKTKIALPVTCLFAFALLWLAITTPAAAANDVAVSITFNPPLTNPNSLAVGDILTATVSATSASNQFVDTWGLYMDFDPAILHVNSVTRLYPITGSDICIVPVGFDNVTGKIMGECADLGGGTTTDGLDILEIEFQVLVTDTWFNLTFDQVCDGVGNDDCFQALYSGINQIATYNDALSNPLAVTLQTMGATNETTALPGLGIVLVVLVLATAVVIFLYKRQYAKLY